MSPYLAYFLGVLTVVFIALLFWLLARSNEAVRGVYVNLVCRVNPVETNTTSTGTNTGNNTGNNDTGSNTGTN